MLEDLAMVAALCLFISQIVCCFLTVRALYDEKFSDNFGIYLVSYCLSNGLFFLTMNFLGRNGWYLNVMHIAILIALAVLAIVFINDGNEHPYFSYPMLYIIACNIGYFLGQNWSFGIPVFGVNLFGMFVYFALPFFQKKTST